MFESESVEKSFNLNYSFITQKREALQKSVQDAKRFSYNTGIEINTEFILQANKGGGVVACSWQGPEASLESMITHL